MLDNNALSQLSVVQAISLVANGSVTVSQLVIALLERIEVRNDKVLAWAFLDRDVVLKEAQRMDTIPVSARGPLHGCIVAVKDIINTKDMPTQYGSPLFKDSFAAVDASVVSILRSQGALIFGKTTTVEFAAYRTISVTRNPKDATRTPGGSSSGSAAAVSDCQVPFALGTQTAGSIIRPAAFCGTVSYKPTWGCVGLDGVKVFSASNDCLGFFSRTVEDMLLISQIFHLPTNDIPLDLSSPPLKIAICHTSAWDSASTATRESLLLVESLLVDSGATVTLLTLPSPFDNILELHRTIMAGEAKANFRAPYLLAEKKSTPSDNPPLLHPDLVNYVNNSSNLSNATLVKAYDEVASLRSQFDAIASKYDCILSPSAMDVAPLFATTGDPRFNSGWTILHAPVVNLPVPREKGELPLGITLVGSRFSDGELLKVAETVEAVFKKHSSGL